jgi:hypothetical protein
MAEYVRVTKIHISFSTKRQKQAKEDMISVCSEQGIAWEPGITMEYQPIGVSRQHHSAFFQHCQQSNPPPSPNITLHFSAKPEQNK